MKNGTGLRGLRKQVETFWQRVLRFIRKQRPSAKEKALAMPDDLEKGKQVVVFKKAKTRTSLKNNILTIDLQDNKKLQSKIASLNDWPNKETDKFRDKYPDKFPRGYQVILTTKKGNKEFHQSSKMSFEAVTPENVKKAVKESIMEFQDNFFEILNASGDEITTSSSWVFDPSKVSRVTVRYFYAQ